MHSNRCSRQKNERRQRDTTSFCCWYAAAQLCPSSSQPEEGVLPCMYVVYVENVFRDDIGLCVYNVTYTHDVTVFWRWYAAAQLCPPSSQLKEGVLPVYVHSTCWKYVSYVYKVTFFLALIRYRSTQPPILSSQPVEGVLFVYIVYTENSLCMGRCSALPVCDVCRRCSPFMNI